MTVKKTHAPITSYFFILLLCLGAGMFIWSFFTTNHNVFFSGLQQIASGIFIVGIGEWINHPLQKSLSYRDRKDFNLQKIRHRKRNPSSLGNLLEICGLILIFTGLAAYI